MIGFVKLDCGMLQSTTWLDRDARDVFITALLMALPREFTEAQAQLAVRSLEPTGWDVPAGWYGFVAAASVGILRMAGVDLEPGLAALERLGAPEPESRSRAFDGRRLARVDGGFIVLNFMRFREKDHTAAERSRRYRESKKDDARHDRHAVTSRSNGVTPRSVTQAEAEAEAEADRRDPSDRRAGLDLGPTATAEDFKLQPAPVKQQRQYDSDALWVFELWKHDTGHDRAELDKKRRARIGARLRDGFTREQLGDAIRNRHNDRFLMGANDSGRVYDGIDTLLRDRAQVERLLALTSAPTPAPRQPHGGGQRAADQLHRQMQRVLALQAEERREKGLP